MNIKYTPKSGLYTSVQSIIVPGEGIVVAEPIKEFKPFVGTLLVMKETDEPLSSEKSEEPNNDPEPSSDVVSGEDDKSADTGDVVNSETKNDSEAPKPRKRRTRAQRDSENEQKAK